MDEPANTTVEKTYRQSGECIKYAALTSLLIYVTTKRMHWAPRWLWVVPLKLPQPC